jgi:hypothetical protein
MTLRGKDYCNCEHAHMLREALEMIQRALDGTRFDAVARAKAVCAAKLLEDSQACEDLWGDIHFERDSHES